jgi:hypothetical protein
MPGGGELMTTSHETTELRCAEPDCTRWHIVRTEHLDNLLAAGSWRCPDHDGTSR